MEAKLAIDYLERITSRNIHFEVRNSTINSNGESGFSASIKWGKSAIVSFYRPRFEKMTEDEFVGLVKKIAKNISIDTNGKLNNITYNLIKENNWNIFFLADNFLKHYNIKYPVMIEDQDYALKIEKKKDETFFLMNNSKVEVNFDKDNKKVYFIQEGSDD